MVAANGGSPCGGLLSRPSQILPKGVGQPDEKTPRERDQERVQKILDDIDAVVPPTEEKSEPKPRQMKQE